jgi:hypothetical protein
MTLGDTSVARPTPHPFSVPACTESSRQLPLHHVFVDFENVQHVDLTLVGTPAVSFTLLLGATQTTLDVKLVEKLLAHAPSVHLVRLTSPGKNALDFTLSYYLGRAALAEPTATFHIVSKDTGYDPLIAHLRSRNIRICRHADFTSLPFTKKSASSPVVPGDLLTCVLEHWKNPLAGRPKSRQTLTNTLLAFTRTRFPDADIAATIEKLCAAGHLEIAPGENGKVTYHT